MNIEVMSQQVRKLDAMVREQKVMVDSMLAVVGGLSSRVDALEAVLTTERIAKMGSGPTER